MPLPEAILYAVWSDFRRAVDPGLTMGIAALQRYLEAHPVGLPFVRSPVFFAISERTDTTFTLVARGQFPMFDNKITGAVFDLQLVCARDLAIINPILPPLVVLQWRVASGQLTLGKKDKWHATVGIVRTEDHQADGTSIVSWGGRGLLELQELHFMVECELVITDEGGFELAFSFELPEGVSIPITIALGINGLSGLFALALKPRMLDDSGVEVGRPDARNYVRWALEARQHSSLSLWQPTRSVPEGITVGAGLHIGTLDGGRTFQARNVGVTVITPEGVILAGGTAIIIDTPSLLLHFVIGYDNQSRSFALGGISHLDYPSADNARLTVNGPAEGLFSCNHPELFYLNIGTRAQPLQAQLRFDMSAGATPLRATAYFQVDTHRVATGAHLAIALAGETFRSIVFELALVIDITFELLVAWNPGQLEALVAVDIELHVILLALFRIVARASASVLARWPHPARFEAALEMRGFSSWVISVQFVRPVSEHTPFDLGGLRHPKHELVGQENALVFQPDSGQQGITDEPGVRIGMHDEQVVLEHIRIDRCGHVLSGSRPLDRCCQRS